LKGFERACQESDKANGEGLEEDQKVRKAINP
jgi:hypothetical protein